MHLLAHYNVEKIRVLKNVNPPLPPHPTQNVFNIHDT